MAANGYKDGSGLGFEVWEEAAIDFWSRQVRWSSEQTELRAELARKLLVLHAEGRIGVRHRKAYIRTALMNAAKAWLKKYNQTKRSFSLNLGRVVDSEEIPESFRELGQDEGDFGLAFRQFWDSLDPHLQRFLVVLEQKNWNVSAAAKASRIHRNTASLWLKKVRLQARTHHLGGD